MEKPDPTKVQVVCDAGPLIHLDELGCLNLLADFHSVIVPSTIWTEVERFRPSVFHNTSVSFEKIAPSEAKDAEIDAISMLYMLHAGEKEALKIMRQADYNIFLTDDTAARLSAYHLGIEVHGTIGVIVRSIRRNTKTCPEVITILKSIPEKSTLFIRSSLLEEVINQVENSK